MDLTVRSMSNQKIVVELNQLSIIMRNIFKYIKFSTNQSEMLAFNTYKPGVLFFGDIALWEFHRNTKPEDQWSCKRSPDIWASHKQKIYKNLEKTRSRNDLDSNLQYSFTFIY